MKILFILFIDVTIKVLLDNETTKENDHGNSSKNRTEPVV